jgi:hypothetical protein
MAKNLVVDALLSRDSYSVHNTGEGSVGSRMRVNVTRNQFTTTVIAALTALAISATAWTQTLAEKEKLWQSCEAAHYTGPREGRRNYTLDNYLWVVTPEFARRYCMPDHMVSTELQGAEAIAFRMVDGADMDICGVDDQGQHHCTRQSSAQFEIYLTASRPLPAIHPEVRFYESRRNTSEWMFSGNQDRVSRSQRYIQGKYTPPPGTVPRYRNTFSHPDPGYVFGLWFLPKGPLPWPAGTLFEVGFRENVVPGIDMLILESKLGIDFGFELKHYKAHQIEPGDPSGRYVIVMHKRDPVSLSKPHKRIPDDFEHVVHLPHAFAMQVRTRAMQSGASNLTDFIQTFQKR